jgi:hypothetical protein
MSARFLVFVIAASAFWLFLPQPVFAGTFSACGTLSSGDYYTQTANITSSSSPCIDITASNVVLDCNFFAVKGSPRPGQGIRVAFASLSNVTVKNCRIENYTILMNIGSNNVVIENNDLFNASGTGSAAISNDQSNVTINANKLTLQFTGTDSDTHRGFQFGVANNVSNNTLSVSAPNTVTGTITLLHAGAGNYSTIRNNTFLVNTQGGSSSAQKALDFLTSGGNVLVENNTFNGTAASLMRVGGTMVNAVIRNNNFTNAFDVGVYLIASAGGCRNATVEFNIFNTGHWIGTSCGGVFRNNTVTSKSSSAVSSSGADHVYQSNVLYSAEEAFIVSGRNIIVENNTVNGHTPGNGKPALQVGQCANCSFTGNIFSGSNYGIDLRNLLDVTWRDNNVTNVSTVVSSSSSNWTQHGPLQMERTRLHNPAQSTANTVVSINTTSLLSTLTNVNPASNPDPTSGLLFKNVSEYVSIANSSAGSYWEIAVYYESTGSIGADSLRMYKRVGSNWHNVSDVGGFLAFQNVPSSRYVWVNVTNLSVFAPMGFGDTTKPRVTNVSAINQNDTSATVTWNTDESSNTSVNYGTTLSLGTTSGVDDLVTFHSRVLYGLSGGTVYFFNVTSCDSAGNCNITGNSSQLPFNFTTLPSGSAGGSTDSDNDGLTDVEEVSTYFTNASAADTDGDGFSDGQEVAVGSDPLDALSYARVSVVKIAPAFEATDLAVFFFLAVLVMVYWLLRQAPRKRR